MLSPRVAQILGIVGAMIAAAIGYWSVGVLRRQGFHAIVIPAGLPGIVGGAIARERSVFSAVVFGVVGFVAAVFTEWSYRPFVADKSLGYFVRHISEVTPIVLGIIVVGSVIGALFALSVGPRRSTSSGSKT